MRLIVPCTETLLALDTLSVARQKRFSSIVPVWLNLASDNELEIVEERGKVEATVPADGRWPPAGATVDLYLLRNAIRRSESEMVELHAIENSIIVSGGNWHIRLELLEFGPDINLPEHDLPPPGPERLPLFRWARRKP